MSPAIQWARSLLINFTRFSWGCSSTVLGLLCCVWAGIRYPDDRQGYPTCSHRSVHVFSRVFPSVGFVTVMSLSRGIHSLRHCACLAHADALVAGRQYSANGSLSKTRFYSYSSKHDLSSIVYNISQGVHTASVITSLFSFFKDQWSKNCRNWIENRWGKMLGTPHVYAATRGTWRSPVAVKCRRVNCGVYLFPGVGGAAGATMRAWL